MPVTKITRCGRIRSKALLATFSSPALIPNHETDLPTYASTTSRRFESSGRFILSQLQGNLKQREYTTSGLFQGSPDYFLIIQQGYKRSCLAIPLTPSDIRPLPQIQQRISGQIGGASNRIRRSRSMVGGGQLRMVIVEIEESSCDVRVEEFSGLFPKICENLIFWYCLAVRPVGRHGIPDIHDRKNARP
jgi:hypothetical protein